MAYLTFHKWLVSHIHNNVWETKTRHLGKVSYTIILLGWRYWFDTNIITKQEIVKQSYKGFFILAELYN